MLTLNQTIEILENFSLKHKSLNSFYFGDEWESQASNELNYPMMQAVLSGSDLTSKGYLINRRFRIIISDWVFKSEKNETHALSDCEQICFDLINYLQQISEQNLLGNFKASVETSLTDFTERGDDEVTGWYFDITITSDIGDNSCNLPINAGNILNDNYIYVGANTVAESNFVVEIRDTNNNLLQSFNTSGTYTVEILTAIRDTLTANTSTIIEPLQ